MMLQPPSYRNPGGTDSGVSHESVECKNGSYSTDLG